MTLNEFYSTLEKFQSSIPVRVVDLAESLGISVFKSDLLPDGVAGKIWFDKSLNSNAGGYAIIVNANDSPVRRRFTIAHEIAHFVLHKELILNGGVIDRNADGILYRSNTFSDEKEWAANKLAAQILMPAAKVKAAYEFGKTSISQLADEFYVSEAAMQIRLKN